MYYVHMLMCCINTAFSLACLLFRSRLSVFCKLNAVVTASLVDLAKSHPICFDRQWHGKIHVLTQDFDHILVTIQAISFK